MTKPQIITQLQSNADFALMFAIDNNPQGVIAALQNAGYNGGDSKEYAYSILTSLLVQGHKDKVIKIISTVNYLETQNNYTGGFKDFFMRSSPPQNSGVQSQAMRDGFSWTGVLAGLGAGLATFAGIALGQQTQTAGTPADANAAAQAQAEADAAAKAKTKKILLIGGISVGGLLLLVGLYFALRTKAPKDGAAS